MSLIQEALKRKSEETEKQPITAETPPEPPPSPLSSQPKTHTILLIVLVVLLFLVLLGGAGVYLISRSNSQQISNPSAAVPVSPVPTVPATTPPPAAVATPAIEKEPEPAESIVEPEEAPPEKAKEPEPNPVPTLDWPQLELTGIALGGNRRIAIINGKMLSAGRTIGEVIVRDVGPTEVIVEFRGERRILHVDE